MIFWRTKLLKRKQFAGLCFTRKVRYHIEGMIYKSSDNNLSYLNSTQIGMPSVCNPGPYCNLALKHIGIISLGNGTYYLHSHNKHSTKLLDGVLHLIIRIKTQYLYPLKEYMRRLFLEPGVTEGLSKLSSCSSFHHTAIKSPLEFPRRWEVTWSHGTLSMFRYDIWKQ